jgi:hypothetical protein
MDDYGKVRLYNASCPTLRDLLTKLRHTQAPAGVWRRSLATTLRRMGQQQDSLARVTAAEILTVTSTRSGSIRYPKSTSARAMLERLGAMERRQYSRGDLTPAAGHDPEVLELWLRGSAKLMKPLRRKDVEDEWHRLGGGQFPQETWTKLKASGSPGERARIFVAAINGCTVESLKKTLQRHRKRQGQQTP